MCGIFGAINFNPKKLDRAHISLNTLKHRGPDGSGFLYEKKENIYFGHRRLSIIDLSSNAAQPMSNYKNNVWLTYNGEIYNYKLIKSELEVDGYKFKTKSDTEVILASYETWGIEKTINKLNGIFAFALADFEKKQIFLIRDQVGVKPMYYCHRINNMGIGSLSFASELKALKKFEDNLVTDNTALYDFLTYRYIPSPKTMYKEIKQLEPGNFLSFNFKSNNIPEIKKYWDFNFGNLKENYSDFLNNIKKDIEESIHNQYIASDVPVSFFLSGGIDSACVLSSASKFKDENLKAYTVKFTNSHRDESVEAIKLASHLNINHEIIEASNISPNLFKIDQLLNWFDQPFSDTSAWPMNLLCKAVSKKTKVAISGDGADEIFSGYKWYKNKSIKAIPYSEYLPKYIRFLSEICGIKIFHKVANRIEPYSKKNKFEKYIFRLGTSLPESWRFFWRKRLELENDYDDYWAMRRYWDDELPEPLRYQIIDFKTFLPDDILTKVDRVSMANSLEVRVPYLDIKIINSAFNASFKFGEQVSGKKILKDIFKNKVPGNYFEKEKTGFSAPERLWDEKLINSPHPTLGLLSYFNKNN